MSAKPAPDQDPENEELRQILPFFKSWRSLYLFVIGELLVLILLFFLFSRAYA